jgi:hypothetical protein
MKCVVTCMFNYNTSSVFLFPNNTYYVNFYLDVSMSNIVDVEVLTSLLGAFLVVFCIWDPYWAWASEVVRLEPLTCILHDFYLRELNSIYLG